MGVDQAPRPFAAEKSVPEAFVRCSPPRMGAKMAPTTGTLLRARQRQYLHGCTVDERARTSRRIRSKRSMSGKGEQS